MRRFGPFTHQWIVLQAFSFQFCSTYSKPFCRCMENVILNIKFEELRHANSDLRLCFPRCYTDWNWKCVPKFLVQLMLDNNVLTTFSNHSYKSCGYTTSFCDFNSTLYGKRKFYTSIYDKFRQISSCRMFSNINRVTNIFKTHPRLLLQPTYGCGWVLFVVCYRPAYPTVFLGQWVTRFGSMKIYVLW